MVTLGDIVDRFLTQERSDGNILDESTIMAQAVAATLYYAGYTGLASEAPEISVDAEISVSEWAVIRPLFMLYVEREAAIQLEASRGLGLDVFGRSTSEIASDITMVESEIPRRAFFQPIITV